MLGKTHDEILNSLTFNQLLLYYKYGRAVSRENAQIFLYEYVMLQNRSAEHMKKMEEEEGWIQILNEDGTINRDGVEASKRYG